jgi:uncharacterized protein
MPDYPIVHIEFSSYDPMLSGKFYTDLFGWKLKAWPEYNYATFESASGPAGGFPKIDGKEFKPGDVIVYVQTDDIEADLKRIEALGGKVLKPRTAIDNQSWYAFFADPSGNRVGLFSGKNPAASGD